MPLCRPYLCSKMCFLPTHVVDAEYVCNQKCVYKLSNTISGRFKHRFITFVGERPFKCPYEGCNRSFTTSNIRKVHLRTHTGERPYVCEIEGCNRSFASATNYKNHSRIHTGKLRDSIEQLSGSGDPGLGVVVHVGVTANGGA